MFICGFALSHSFSSFVFSTNRSHVASTMLRTSLTRSSLVRHIRHSPSPPTPIPISGLRNSISLATHPPPLRCTSRNPHGSSSSSRGPIVLPFTPEPTRTLAEAGMREAVRIKVRSLGSATGEDAAGACPLVRMRVIWGTVEILRWAICGLDERNYCGGSRESSPVRTS